MKRSLIVFLSMAATTLVVGSCLSLRNSNKNQDKTKGTTNMTRTVTNSGLAYEVLKEGSGATPQVGQNVTVHYTGWLEGDNGQLGQQFDSSVDRSTPFTFKIGAGRVIKGWDEGVMTMKIGEKRRLIIPSKLGYGANGAGNVIPPHATLIFDVELLSIS